MAFLSLTARSREMRISSAGAVGCAYPEMEIVDVGDIASVDTRFFMSIVVFAEL